MTRRVHLCLVRGDAAPVSGSPSLPTAAGGCTADPSPAQRQRPPIRPRRSAYAVRKSLRLTLTGSERMLCLVAHADPRFPGKAKEAVAALARHGARVVALTEELRAALECEQRYRLWSKGRPYVE